MLASLTQTSTSGRSSNNSSTAPGAQLGELRKPMGSLASQDLPKGVTMTQSQEDSSSSLNVWNCIETSRKVRCLNPRCQWKMLWISGSGQTSFFVTLFSSQKSETSQAEPSGLGTTKAGMPHLVAQHQMRMPSFPLRGSLVLTALC